MVQIVLAGGAGNVGREVLDGLIEAGSHDLVVFTRSAVDNLNLPAGVKLVQVDYNDHTNLASHLKGADTVLSFIVSHLDPKGTAQKNLVDACIETGVRRFAPSEWALRGNSGNPMYESKDILHAYLRELNKDQKVLEYCLFQPGLFVNYMAFPHKTTKHLQLFCTPWDLEHRRAIIPADRDFPMTLTTVEDMVKVVVAAVRYPGVWPEIGGISGTSLMNSEFLKLAGRVRGSPIHVEAIPQAQFSTGDFETSWLPPADHPAISEEMKLSLGKTIVAGVLQAALVGGFEVSDEWNRLLPNLRMTSAEEFLVKVWKGKP